MNAFDWMIGIWKKNMAEFKIFLNYMTLNIINILLFLNSIFYFYLAYQSQPRLFVFTYRLLDLKLKAGIWVP